MIIYYTASLKLILSITQKDEFYLALTVDGLYISYNNANSPNPSPAFNCFITWLSIYISTIPLIIIKKHEPGDPI
jgi:hypothetical protein